MNESTHTHTTHALTHQHTHYQDDNEENQLLLKESDFISFFDQFPFSDLSRHILQVSNGQFHDSVNQSNVIVYVYKHSLAHVS